MAAVREEVEDSGGEVLLVTTDPDSVATAFERVRAEIGDPEVFVYNAPARSR